jgi:hypothetical protein
MANTYVLIASNTLSSSAASVTFSSIPGTYTDLVLRISGRTDYAATSGEFWLQFNGNSSTLYSNTFVYGNGTTAGSDRASSSDRGFILETNNANDTSNTFSSSEIYIPSYTASQNKPYSNFGTGEQNSTAATTGYNRGANAGLFRSTSAITSITMSNYNGNWVSGSSFFLYGIKAN